MRDYWYLLWLNPEPWAVGAVSGKRISPNPNLVAFQQAVREAMKNTPKLPPEFCKIEFYFWRQQAKYLDVNDRVRQRNQADATNMQKGLEDALQGILFDNDRDVRDIRSVIVKQGASVEPCILIHAAPLDIGRDIRSLPKDIFDDIIKGPPKVEKTADKWETAEDMF